MPSPAGSVNLHRNVRPKKRCDPTVPISVTLADKTRARLFWYVGHGMINFRICAHLNPDWSRSDVDIKLLCIAFRVPGVVNLGSDFLHQVELVNAIAIEID